MNLSPFEVGLVGAFAIGLLAVGMIRSRIASWSRGRAFAAILCVTLFGGLPYVLLEGGLLPATHAVKSIAVAYILAFTLIGTFVLNLTLERQVARRR